jgi:hypothetical protein
MEGRPEGMERRNLDFEVEMSAAQWSTLTRRADALGPERAGFDRGANATDEIQVFLRTDDAPPHWRDWVGDPETYGPTTREVARFHFNSGRPYAEIDAGAEVVEPGYFEHDVAAMQAEMEEWVRGKWHELLRESGIHYERGHTAL